MHFEECYGCLFSQGDGSAPLVSAGSLYIYRLCVLETSGAVLHEKSVARFRKIYKGKLVTPLNTTILVVAVYQQRLSHC